MVNLIISCANSSAGEVTKSPSEWSSSFVFVVQSSRRLHLPPSQVGGLGFEGTGDMLSCQLYPATNQSRDHNRIPGSQCGMLPGEVPLQWGWAEQSCVSVGTYANAGRESNWQPHMLGSPPGIRIWQHWSNERNSVNQRHIHNEGISDIRLYITWPTLSSML